MRHAVAVLVLVVAGPLVACQDHEFHPPSDQERAARAEAVYSPALFDTIAWESSAARVQAGNLVFADECRRCHGPLGRGDTDYAAENDLDVPSLVEPGWAYAGSPDSVRHHIFVGHGREMPNWGVGRLTPRQIDAAAGYLLLQLRPEVLTDSVSLPGA